MKNIKKRQSAIMESVENLFSDNEGNHLAVALDFYDENYKYKVLNIPVEFSDIQIVDISISKVELDKPIHYSAFVKMIRWLLGMFNECADAVFSFSCSIDELETNHALMSSSEYRWKLFDVLYRRSKIYFGDLKINVQDIIIGPDGFQTYGRAFYRDRHAPIIHLITSHLQEKQQ